MIECAGFVEVHVLAGTQDTPGGGAGVLDSSLDRNRPDVASGQQGLLGDQGHTGVRRHLVEIGPPCRVGFHQPDHLPGGAGGAHRLHLARGMRVLGTDLAAAQPRHGVGRERETGGDRTESEQKGAAGHARD